MPLSADRRGSPRDRANNGCGGVLQRLLFAATGLAAGNAALLVFLIYSALPSRAALLKVHMGQADVKLPRALEIVVIRDVFRAGTDSVGVPIALAFPVRLLSRLAWPCRIVMSAALGQLALVLIFVVLFAIQSRRSAFSLAHTESLWPFSILVSTISFLVYAALLRRRY